MSRLQLEFTPVQGCYVLHPKVFEDMRGVFLEAYNKEDFLGCGLPTVWPQDNISSSEINVLRGLHFQEKNPQGKLVRCMRGKILDMCLDLRRDSPTFLNVHTEELSGAKSMYLPPGTAHGFVALEPDSVIYYKCTTLYDSQTDSGVWALSKSIRDLWPVNTGAFIMSEKDKRLPTIETFLEQGKGF